MTQMAVGTLANLKERFCPFGAVSKYPYKYMRGDEQDVYKVTDRYFAAGQFRMRGWTIYYVQDLPESGSQTILFIPKREVEALFADIESETGIQVTFPDVTRHPGFDLDFDLDGIPRLRYLGRFDGRTSIVDLMERVGAESAMPPKSDTLDESSLPMFRQKMQAALVASRAIKKANKDKKRRARVDRKSRWLSELRRGQCYLGIRPRLPVEADQDTIDPNLTWEESQQLHKQKQDVGSGQIAKLDCDQPVPNGFYLDVVFISFDIEAYEHDSRKLTEFGFAILDTRDVLSTPPGRLGANWMAKMRHRHLRVAEYSHLENKHYLTGCSNDFRPEFGTSEWISTNEVPKAVAACFRPPYSEKGLFQPFPTDKDQLSRYGSNTPLAAESDDMPKRNVVLVGHNIKSDILMLKTIGYNVENLSNVVEAIDTANVHQAWQHAESPANLGKILLDLDMIGWHLHNAGNDAAYTLQALVAMLVLTSDEANSPPKEVSQTELDQAAADAQADLLDQHAEWAEANLEVDGGLPIPIHRLEIEDRMITTKHAEEKRAARANARGRGSSHKGNSMVAQPSLSASQADGSSQVNTQGTSQGRGGGRRGRGGRGGRGGGHEKQPATQHVIMDNEDYFS